MRRPYNLENPILIVPLLLFVLSLAGLYMYTRRQQALNTLGTASFIISLIGLILAITHVFLGEYWPWWFGGWWYGGYGGLFERYMPSPGLLWVLWYGSFGPGFVVLALGLVLFGLSIRKTKVMLSWPVLALIMASIATGLMGLGIKIFVVSETDMTELINKSRPYLAILALFGVAWISLGLTLCRSANKLITIAEIGKGAPPKPVPEGR
jgi:hypothetical protein